MMRRLGRAAATAALFTGTVATAAILSPAANVAPAADAGAARQLTIVDDLAKQQQPSTAPERARSSYLMVYFKDENCLKNKNRRETRAVAVGQ